MSSGRSSETPAGVQVVRLGEGERRYELDEAALRQLLLRPDVRDLPAVVVSVAGVSRGGKSFILDFFLRYLNAPRSSQLSGEWLGNEDDQLKGFHWRGGADRDTTGIHLWSEPIITTLAATGKKVAVLLMDTQGTFDSESTIGQNSTIFALSTLMSSVQIYNLSGNINEDDLQHLQLFTEYGKLVCQAQGKAFQTLMFLVRDWLFPYDNAYGYDGGAALLRKKLQSKPNQKEELRKVREHINSSFEPVKCFLMPHPGLSVTKQTFAGCIRDLTEEFRLALQELVPSLFDPKRLTPKLMNGEQVRTQDLFEYFQMYVNIFNSDEVPEAVTIFKATADACLLAATRAARSLYTTRMEEITHGARSVPASSLNAAHAAARADAELCYTQKKKLGSQEDADARLQDLIKELDGSLSLYTLNNEAKVRETMSLAKKTYSLVISCVCGEDARLCLHPQELEDLHAEASLAAFSLFDAARDVPEDDEDDERLDLKQSLEQKYKHLCAINKQNNKRAVQEARDLYATRMRNKMPLAGASPDRLRSLHQEALGEAEEFLAKQRNRSTLHEDDPYLEELLQEINDQYVEFERSNNIIKDAALQAAIHKYNNCMASAWGPQICCFHPQALVDVHETIVIETLEHCRVGRDEDGEDDEFKAQVMEHLERRFLELKNTNEFNNERAVEQAVWLYTMKLGKTEAPPSPPPSAFGGFFNMFSTSSAQTDSRPSLLHHEACKQEAVKVFKERRRGTDWYQIDEYYNMLIMKINDIYWK